MAQSIINKCIAVFSIALLVTICCVPSSSAAPSIRMKRAFGDSYRNHNPPSLCPMSTPCGWAVYTPFTRNVDYFMQNNCACPGSQVCVRTEDDLAVSAFVYRCREPKTTSTTTTTTMETPSTTSASSNSNTNS